ncbi:MAG: hypothetical protein WA133_04345 [Syntrophales bacterium]
MEDMVSAQTSEGPINPNQCVGGKHAKRFKQGAARSSLALSFKIKMHFKMNCRSRKMALQHMETKGMKIGILTAGGDCPGINAAIRGVANRELPQSNR